MVIDDLIYGKLLDSLYPKSFLMTDEDGLQHEVIHYGDVKNAIEDLRIELKKRVGVSKTENGDTIYRQAAIDVLDVLCQEHRYRIPGKRETYSEYNEAWQDALDRAEGAIGNLPSAQPNHNAEVSKMVDDLISRQAAIDALDCINGVEEVLRSLPSAHPTNEMLERCKFEYIHACKIVSIPTPDVTGKDKQDAYAVIKALHPIFGDVPFAKVKRGDSDAAD